jgi:hypothetical protein
MVQSPPKKDREVKYFTGRNAQALIQLYLNGTEGLSHLEFQRDGGGYRLSAAIYDLIHESGLVINMEWETVESTGRRYKRYRLGSAINILSAGINK